VLNLGCSHESYEVSVNYQFIKFIYNAVFLFVYVILDTANT